jgi:hypothetical protein
MAATTSLVVPVQAVHARVVRCSGCFATVDPATAYKREFPVTASSGRYQRHSRAALAQPVVQHYCNFACREKELSQSPR